jgi:lysophospholipase
MGGLVVTRHRQLYADALPVTATIVSSPFLGIAAKIPAWKKALSKAVVNVYPRLAVPTELNAEHVSHDPQVVKAYINDPLVLKKTTAGWFENIQKTLGDVHRDVTLTQGPLHILLASDDKLVDPAATRKFYAALPPGMDKSLTEFPGFYHEIFNELDKEKAWQALGSHLARY